MILGVETLIQIFFLVRNNPQKCISNLEAHVCTLQFTVIKYEKIQSMFHRRQVGYILRYSYCQMQGSGRMYAHLCPELQIWVCTT